MNKDSSNQRIGQLTPLAAVLELIEARLNRARPQESALHAARGFTLAEDVTVAERPAHAMALRDGFAVDSAAIADAGPYSPVTLSLTARRIDVGQPMPSEADAVLPLDAVAFRGYRAEAVASVAAGEGVLPAGTDAAPSTPLRRAGEIVRPIDIAALGAAGIDRVSIRAPRVHIVWGGEARSNVIGAALANVIRLAEEAGGVVTGRSITLNQQAFEDTETAALIAIGGTGSGRRDTAIDVLARHGRVEAYGIAVSPGETAALGFAGDRPVLLMPGRLDSTLAIWLLIGRHLVAKLAGGKVEDFPAMLPLKRKIASTIGLTELISVRCADGMAEPLASGYLSLAALARSDGWIVVPAESEGFAPGTPVAVNPWP